MSKWRTAFVTTVILVIIGGHFYAIAADREYWPFSQYRLFARAQDGPLEQVQLYGVPENDSLQEFPLGEVNRKFSVDNTRLRSRLRYISFTQTLTSREREEKLNDQLNDVLAQYEKRRLKGGNDWPPLQGVRLYQSQWDLESQPDSALEPPDRKRLIHEVQES